MLQIGVTKGKCVTKGVSTYSEAMLISGASKQISLAILMFFDLESTEERDLDLDLYSQLHLFC